MVGCIGDSYQVYSDEEIEFQCPKNWFLIEGGFEVDESITSKQMSCMNPNALFDVVWTKPAILSLEEYSEEFLRQINNSKFTDIEYRGDVSVSGFPGKKYSYFSRTDSGEPTRGEKIIAQCNGKLLFVSMDEVEDDYGKNQDEIAHMLDSIKCK